MISILGFGYRFNYAAIAALVAIAFLYLLARLPQIDPNEYEELASKFRFEQLPLSSMDGFEKKSIRNVHPDLDHISAWISSVGAAVAVNDLDGDGLPNDACYVDTRIDQIIVSPIPGTGNRYSAFRLNPAPLPYEPATMAPMGCLPGDLNEDGLIDLVGYYWGRTPIAFMKNVDGYQPIEIAPRVERWFTNAATMADFDGDGHVDLLITNYFQDGAKILDANATSSEYMQHSMSRAFNAGSTHFFLLSVDDSGTQRDLEIEHLSNVLGKHADNSWTLAVGAADLDGDLLPEIYFANDFGPDRLLHNRSNPGDLQFAILEGRRTLTTPASKVLGKDSFKGMGIDFGDLNSDGHLDIFVSNIAAEFALQESHFAFISTGNTEKMSRGVAPFNDESESLGLSRSDWAWDTKIADLNNDGSPEILQATGFVKGEINRWPELQELALGNDELLKHPRFWPRFVAGDDLSGHAHNPFFARGRSGRFQDIAAGTDLDQPYVSRGIAVADFEGDGDLDFAVANQWDTSFVYTNKCPDCGKSLALKLLLPLKGRTDGDILVRNGFQFERGSPAIGAQAKVETPDNKILISQVDGGNGHSGNRSHELHFGLGSVSSSQKMIVDLRWRNRTGFVREHRLNLRPGAYTIVLGESQPTYSENPQNDIQIN